MSLVDVLLRTNRVKRVLFLADRKELRDQAYYENFKKFFPNESMTIVYSGTVDRNSRIYVSTIQTFENVFRDFSVGFFRANFIHEDASEKPLLTSPGLGAFHFQIFFIIKANFQFVFKNFFKGFPNKIGLGYAAHFFENDEKVILYRLIGIFFYQLQQFK